MPSRSLRYVLPLLASMSALTLAAPDLKPYALSVPPGLVGGRAYQVTCAVTNQGDTEVPGLWYDMLYLSSNETWESSDPVLGGGGRQGLAAGATYTRTNSITLPAMAGDQYLILRVDATNGVSESDEGNNTLVARLPIGVPPGPAIAREPSVLSRSVALGQNASNAVFQVWNSGTGTLNFAVGTEAPWLTPGPTSGSSTGEHDVIQIGFATAGLPLGLYTGIVNITSLDATNSPQPVKVIMSVTNPPGPQLMVGPTNLSRSVPQGQNASNDVLYVRNTGGGVLNYELRASSEWLTPSPASGSSTGEYDQIQILYNTAGLVAGWYTGIVSVISGNTSNAPLAVKVVMAVTLPPPGPTIVREPSQFTLSVPLGQSPSNNVVQLWNGGTGVLNYEVSSDSGWLNPSPTSGSSTGEHDQVQINYATAGLALGTYTGTISIVSADATNSPQKVRVVLSVMPRPAGPSIVRDPSVFSRSIYAGQIASSNVFYVWNGGTGMLNYAVSPASDWLTVSPTSGSSTGEHDQVWISYNAAGLAQGTYTGMIQIAADVTNSPQTVKVILAVTKPPAGPTIVREPSAFYRSVPVGQSADTNVFFVWNGGTGTLNYAVSTETPWMALDPQSGSSTGEHDPVLIRYSTAGLALGTYTGVVSITSADATNSPQKVTVTMSVVAPPSGPTLLLSPASFSRSVYTGQNAESNVFYVCNTGTGTLSFAASSDAPWLMLDPRGGSVTGSTGQTSGANYGTPARVVIRYDTVALGAGMYTGTINVVSGEATNSPQTVRVVMAVMNRPAGPTIAREPSAFSGSVYAGQNASSNLFYVWNGGTGTLNYAISTDAPWIRPDPASGSSTGEHDRVLLMYSTAELGAGQYTGTVQIISGDATNSPQTVKVTMKVMPPPGGPTIVREPSAFSLSIYAGQNAAGNPFYLRNGGAGTLNYTIDSSATWLTTDPTSGSSTGEQDRVQINYTTAGLGVGLYTGLVTIASADATNSPQQVKITLNVMPALPGPTIVVSPSSIYRTVASGGIAESNVFYVCNAGTGTLNFAVSSDSTWMTVDPTGGSVTGQTDRTTSPGNYGVPSRIGIRYITSGLGAGSYTGRVSVSSADASNSPQSVVVYLTILPPPPPTSIACYPQVIYRSSTANSSSNAEYRTFDVWNAGTGVLHYALSSDAQWLIASPAEGVSTGEHDRIIVRCGTETLSSGVYTGQISITSADAANSPQIVKVIQSVLPGREMRVGGAGGGPGGDVTVPIGLSALGNENALAFSLAFDSSVLQYTGVSLSSEVPGASLIANADQSAQGRLGVMLALPAGATFPAGFRPVANVRFTIVAGTAVPATVVGFDDLPVARGIVDVNGAALQANWIRGSVTITASTGFEGDVSPRSIGDGVLSVADYEQVGRFAAGVESPSSAAEFQRADCLPRTNQDGRVIGGDGKITVADWVQVGRYVAGLDPATPACGPTAPAILSITASPAAAGGLQALAIPDPTGLELRAEDLQIVCGQTRRLRVGLTALGSENAVGFSLTFDPTLLAFDHAEVGSGASGASLVVNTDDLGNGHIGITLALPMGQFFAAGSDVAVGVYFTAIGSADAVTTVSLGDQPTAREIVDASAQVLTAEYQDATVTVEADSDGDGMSDTWELDHFGTAQAAEPDEDADGDGASNYAEFLAGTDPNSADDVFRITTMDMSDAQVRRIEWLSTASRTYRLLKAGSANGEYLPVARGLEATPPVNAYDDTDSPGPVFYRIETEQP